jgi:hypothetical protein
MAIVALSSVLSACGGSDEEPTSSPTKTSSAPAATTPAPTPTVPAQPVGANGVTYEIQNWDQHAADPAVLAWKQTMEAVGGSTNTGKLLEPVTAGMAKRVLRPYVQSLGEAWDGGWTLQPVGKVRIDSAATTGNKAKLVTCLWGPSISYYDKDDQPVGASSVDEIKVWSRQQVEMTSRDGRWIISKLEFKDTCPGEAP